ncbi:MAG: hypothetical protein Fur002_17630 [Anaerolineales bacterium]
MSEHRCPIGEKNQKAHAVFIQMINEYYEEFKQGGGSEELAAKIHESLSDWFFNHVQRIDTGLYNCIHQ